MPQFSGRIYGGLIGHAVHGGVNCNENGLLVYASGILLNGGDDVCVSFDSVDVNGSLSCTIADFVHFAVEGFNCTVCDPCFDYNEDFFVTVLDFGIFAGFFNNSTCP